MNVVYSLLPLNGQLYKTESSLKRTPRVGPSLSLLTLYLTVYKMDISLRRTHSAGPKVSVLEGVECKWRVQSYN